MELLGEDKWRAIAPESINVSPVEIGAAIDDTPNFRLCDAPGVAPGRDHHNPKSDAGAHAATDPIGTDRDRRVPAIEVRESGIVDCRVARHGAEMVDFRFPDAGRVRKF